MKQPPFGGRSPASMRYRLCQGKNLHEAVNVCFIASLHNTLSVVF